MGASATQETRKKDPTSLLLSRGVESLLRPSHFKETDGAQPSMLEAKRGKRAEPYFNHDFSRIPAQGLSSHHQALQPESQPCQLALSDSRTCSFGGACHIGPVRVQTKLAINQPGDEYEQEADRIAEEVVNGSAAGISRSKAPGYDGYAPGCREHRAARRKRKSTKMPQKKPERHFSRLTSARS